MSVNPYQPPQLGPEGYTAFRQMSREEVLAGVRWPAIFLLSMAALTAIGRVAGLCFQFIAMAQAAQGPNATAYAVGAVSGNGIALLLNIATIVGAYKMLQLQSYGAAMSAAIISVVPICSPCILLGIPFGIWALVVLNDPQVKSWFQP